jgi:predicted transcriptional regulator
MKQDSLTASSQEMVTLTGRITAAYLRGKQKPAVPIRRSVTAEYIVCLEDGRKLKMLKRHLSTTYAMTLDQYRAKWNLPADYPMAAPAYAEKRSDLARASGLGRRRPEPEPQPVSAPKKRGRPRATA